ncbi:MAG: hypothetical protein IPI82_09005 [Candidatus Microthrix sp.]|nr:hypothetical protein [Candidatus Microthrix sp.]MBK7322577.1 hypothetical protein [Candidatus Microthrix sp.]
MSNRPRVADALFESLLYEIVDGVRPPGSQPSPSGACCGHRRQPSGGA